MKHAFHHRPWLKHRIEVFAEAKGSVIEGEPSSGVVVAFEIALVMSHPHSMGDQTGEPLTEGFNQSHHLTL